MMNATALRRNARNVVCRPEGPPEAAAPFAAVEAGPAVLPCARSKTNVTRNPRADFGAHTRRSRLRRPLLDGLAAALLALLATLLLAGCGGKETIAKATPQATAEAFIEAMAEADYDLVAAGFDYETNARRDNPDWDTFGQSQRNLIVGKLQENKARELQALAGMFASGEASVGDVEEQGDTATVTINAGANTLELEMNNIEGQWYVYNIEEQTG